MVKLAKSTVGSVRTDLNVSTANAFVVEMTLVSTGNARHQIQLALRLDFNAHLRALVTASARTKISNRKLVMFGEV